MTMAAVPSNTSTARWARASRPEGCLSCPIRHRHLRDAVDLRQPQSARKHSITTPSSEVTRSIIRAERVFLMESHIGVSVTILTSDYDSPNGSPTREIAKILLVRILCIELVGWNKLVVKV